MRTARRLGLGLAAAAVLIAAYTDAAGHPQARTALLIAAGIAGGPAVLHWLFIGLWADDKPRRPMPAPPRLAALDAKPTAAALTGRPSTTRRPSPRPRELTN